MPTQTSARSVPTQRVTFLVVSWAAYVAFYLCRKNLSIILPVFARDHLYSTAQSAHLVLLFSIAYCAGQFVMGALADRFGGRLVVMCGMILSACVTAAMGFSSHFGSLALCQTINGAAQAAGWVGLMKLLKQYPSTRNGVAMGWWSTNYVVGGFAAALLATYALNSPWLGNASWRKAAWVPAGVLLLYSLVFLLATRHTVRPATKGPASSKNHSLAIFKIAFSIRRIRALMAAYFIVKLIRYSLLFWLPLYLTDQLLMTPVGAGYASSQLEGYGVLGVVAAGYLSDYVFKARRFPVAMLMMVLLSFICVIASYLSPGAPAWRIGLIVALLGCATYGADTILVGAAVQDAAKLENVGTVAGVVDGAGSFGQVLSPLLVAFVSSRFGWPAVFRGLAAMAIACSVLLAWNLGLERKGNLRVA
jgi:MFS transporter, OPA family, sugar phosphate sensor protein UhpC